MISLFRRLFSPRWYMLTYEDGTPFGFHGERMAYPSRESAAAAAVEMVRALGGTDYTLSVAPLK